MDHVFQIFFKIYSLHVSARISVLSISVPAYDEVFPELEYDAAGELNRIKVQVSVI